MKKKLKIGIIGPGRHFTNKIYPVLKNSKFFSIQYILRRKKNKKFKKIETIEEDQFFKKDLDFVYIATPNMLHEKYILKSIKSGFNVICEKPFITRKKNLFKILNLSKKNKKLIF